MIKLIDIINEILLEDRCKRIADRKYNKPSAYKSGAIVRCRKGNIWKDLKETDNPQSGKAAPYGSGYAKVKEVIKKILEEKLNNNQDSIKQVFENIPELSNVGTQEQYSQYLNTIFPSSDVKDIVYHGSRSKDIEGGRLRPSSEGVYGEGIYVQIKQESTGTFGSNTLFLMIDTKKPFNFYKENGKANDLFTEILEKWRKTKKFYFAEAAKEEFQDEIKKVGFDSIKTEEGGDNLYYILFNPEQTHILGSKQDIEDFKKYVSKTIKEELLSEKVKETLRTWFSRKGAPGKKGGWVDCNTCREVDGKTKCKACGREKGEKRSKYPSCRPTPSQCKTPGKGKKWGKTK